MSSGLPRGAVDFCTLKMEPHYTEGDFNWIKSVQELKVIPFFELSEKIY